MCTESLKNVQTFKAIVLVRISSAMDDRKPTSKVTQTREKYISPSLCKWAIQSKHGAPHISFNPQTKPMKEVHNYLHPTDEKN